MVYTPAFFKVFKFRQNQVFFVHVLPTPFLVLRLSPPAHLRPLGHLHGKTIGRAAHPLAVPGRSPFSLFTGAALKSLRAWFVYGRTAANAFRECLSGIGDSSKKKRMFFFRPRARIVYRVFSHLRFSLSRIAFIVSNSYRPFNSGKEIHQFSLVRILDFSLSPQSSF